MATESALLDIDDRLILLTPDEIRHKIEEHEKQLRVWRALLVAVDSKEEKSNLKAPKRRLAVPVITDFLIGKESASQAEIVDETGISYAAVHKALRKGDRFECLSNGRFRLRTNGVSIPS